MRWFFVVLALLLTLPTAPPAMATPAQAQSAEPSKTKVHYDKYLAFKKDGKYEKAEFHAKKALSLFERDFGTNNKTYASLLNNLALLYEQGGRYAESAAHYKRSLTIYEKVLEPGHSFIATNLNNLAELYRVQGRYAEAEPLFLRSLSIVEKTLGPDHLSLALPLNNLARLYRSQKRYSEVEPLVQRSIVIYEKALGPDHPSLALALNNLATFYVNLGRYKQAEPLFQRSIAIYEKVLRPDHPTLGISYDNLGALFWRQGRNTEAKPLYKRAIKIKEKARGPDHPTLALSLNSLAWFYFSQQDWQGAAKNWRRATNIFTRRAARNRQIGRGITGRKKSEITQNKSYFEMLIKSVFRQHGDTAQTKTRPIKRPIDEMFETAQWAMESQAAGALAQMSARRAAGSGELAKLVRERQDKVGDWQKLDKKLIAARSHSSQKRNRKAEQIGAVRLAAIDKRIAQIDQKLRKEFPGYAALASPKPLTIKQVQAQLGDDEALILLLDTLKLKPTPAETFIWAVTRDKAVWKRAKLGAKELSDKIALLRKELDPSTATRSAKTKRGFAPAVESAGFSLDTAHELYSKLLGPVEEVIKGKSHLMIVASGPLTALPFQVLVKTKPKDLSAQKYKKADWLIRHHAITTLPSVASLKALRGIAKTVTRAPQPLIGFADPVFSKGKDKPIKLASADQKNRGYTSFFRGRSVDLASLSGLASLPGTRRELEGIGKILKVADKHLHYGVAASERAVKKAALDQYRIVYFATHGLIAGDVKGLGEPALAFSLPAIATSLDDGLLTASEVTELKLNAEWLVMSACNTAAGDRPGAEALSGLARAFFYAGAKTLLVSHWPVGDEAAVALTTHAFKNMQSNPKLGKAEALRRSMLLMIDKGDAADAHPTNWAPFVIVGEGGEGR